MLSLHQVPAHIEQIADGGMGSDESLNLHWFASLEDAREEIETWRNHYNHVRPHRSLGKKPPAVFAKEAA